MHDSYLHHTHIPFTDYEMHKQNYKQHIVTQENSLRMLVLRRNELGDLFAEELSQVLIQDCYLKGIDLAGNQIGDYGVEQLVKVGLMRNQTLLKLDLRVNPGFSTKNRKYAQIGMIRNCKRQEEE